MRQDFTALERKNVKILKTEFYRIQSAEKRIKNYLISLRKAEYIMNTKSSSIK